MEKTVVKRKAGRPKGIKAHERLDLQQYRAQLRFGDYLKDIDQEIASLRESVRRGKASPAIIGASKTIILARLSLIHKVLPDLKATEHTGQVDIEHTHTAPINDLELVSRLRLWREQQQADNKIIDITPEKQAASIVGGILQPTKQPAAILDGMKTATGEKLEVPEAKPADFYDFL